MADVRRVLGTLADDVDQHDTADGRGKSVAESVARFARIFGRDSADATMEDWRVAAGHILREQMTEIRLAMSTVLGQDDGLSTAPVVAAGIGAGEIEALAKSVGRPSFRFGDLASVEPECREWATRCAPAAAIALLAGAR
jgi:uncharacterized hydantoinase/oxoprolinase family protein